MVSYDAMDNEGMVGAEAFEDLEAPSMEELIMAKELYERLHHAVEVLPKAERELIRAMMLWGLDIVGLNTRISEILNQTHALTMLNKQGLVDPDMYITTSNQLAEQLRKACFLCMYKLLEGKKPNSAAASFDLFHARYNRLLTAPLSYLREHRPFEEKLTLPEQFRKAKGSYFDGIQNFSNQLIQL